MPGGGERTARRPDAGSSAVRRSSVSAAEPGVDSAGAYDRLFPCVFDVVIAASLRIA
jgi:hypothetical protein